MLFALAEITTPAVDIYGPDNLARLQEIQKSIDPERVFDLTGGFKIREEDDIDVGRQMRNSGDQVPLVLANA